MIAAMIDKCSSQHTSCKLTESDVLPRRLLDVSETVRLREFSTETTRCSDLGNYLTLSHCYGTDQSILHTTTQTLKAFEDSISWSELPRTFQDAISLTRALGLRWLWIDSLCILQDSEEEKLEESARMDEIFGNSYFTIAATSAADSSGGLFFPKPRLVEVQVEGDISVFVREQPTHFNFESDADRKPHSGRDCHPFSVAGAPSPDAPLLGRAWPYAERLLARRVLHFTKSELIFECREGYECECGRLDNQRLDSPPTDTVKQKYAEISGASSREDTLDTLIPRLEATSLTDVSQRDQALDLWSHIVSSFTSKDITHGKDRLIAISSVAKAFSTSLRSGYAAGQWTFNVCNLLWYPNDGSKSHRPSYKVPTWSWASVEGSPIFFDNETAMDLSCAVEFKSGDGKASKWSPMSGGTLDLTAALATEVKFTVQDLTGSFLTKNGVSVSFTPDVSPPGGKSEVTPGETLICIFVSMTFRSSILGLVLKQNPSSNVYRRVGRLECTTCEGNVDDNDAEALFGYWFPDVSDMTKIDDGPHKTFVIE